MNKILIVGTFLVAFLLLSITSNLAMGEKKAMTNDVIAPSFLDFDYLIKNYPITGGWLLVLIAILFRILFGISFPF